MPKGRANLEDARITALTYSAALLAVFLLFKSEMLYLHFSRRPETAIDSFQIAAMPIVFMEDAITWGAYFALIYAFFVILGPKSSTRKVAGLINLVLGTYTMFTIEFYRFFYTPFRFSYAGCVANTKTLGTLIPQALSLISVPVVLAKIALIFAITCIIPPRVLNWVKTSKRQIFRDSYFNLVYLAVLALIIFDAYLLYQDAVKFYTTIENIDDVSANPLTDLARTAYTAHFGKETFALETDLRHRGFNEGDYVFLNYTRPLIKASKHNACATGLSGVDCSVDADKDGFNLSVDCDDNNASIHPDAVDDPNTWLDEDCNTSGKKKLNVILVVLESSNPNMFGVYGAPYNATPRIDELSEYGITFNRFYAAASFSCISMPAIECSVHPYVGFKRITSEFQNMSLLCLSEVLKNNGYRTALFHSGAFNLCGEKYFMNGRGFDRMILGDNLTDDKSRIGRLGDFIIVDPSFAWIDQDNKTPFFIYYYTTVSHFPHNVPEEFNKFGTDTNLDSYLNTVYYTDSFVGRIYDELRKRGIENDTLIVLVGDHGEAFGKRGGQYGHGVYVYDEYVRVPFILINQVYFHGEHNDATRGRDVDVVPTILDILSIDSVNPFEGESVFRGGESRTVIFVNADNSIRGIIEGDLKLIYNINKKEVLLFNLSADPGEDRNLAGEMPEKAEELLGYMNGFRTYHNRLVEEDRVWSQESQE